MRGRESLRKKIKARKSRQHKHVGGGTDFAFKFLRTSQLIPDVKYIFRILDAHSTHNPEGVGFQAYHTIELAPGRVKDGGKYKQVLAKEAWDNPEEAEASIMIDKLLDYLDDPRILDRLDTDVVNAINKLEASITYLFPTIWYGSWQEQVTDDGIKLKFVPASSIDEVEPSGFIFQVTADTLFDAIDNIAEEDPNYCKYQGGRNLKFSMNSNYHYTVMPELKPSDLDPRASNLISDSQYPRIKKLCSSGKLTAEQVENLLSEAWWWDDVSPFLGE